MKEQLISFETAKLAKEKGFKVGFLNTVYNPDGELQNLNTPQYWGFIPVQAPTQSLLQRWLRDIHAIYVLPMPLNDETKFYFDVVVLEIQEYPIEIDFEQYSNNMHCIEVKTYEEALEIGLLEALKLIK